ncbi:MAG: ATP-binding cassette domain-containing protein [Candidatus Omnitrophica bacterium]|nr:ATP-binding cassette domain-containing protein [Candidatus Omnitrophota bacterium]
MAEELLRIDDLHTSFFLEDSVVRAVEGVTFSVRRGEALGLVGESGCGKSVTALSMLRLVQEPGRVLRGRVTFSGRDLLTLPESAMRRVRGGEIAMIFQEPKAALNPVFTIEFQIQEMLRVHTALSKADRRRRTVELLDKVGIAEPAQRMKDYPHQLSGGQAQRVMTAMALSCRPKLLVADEPTTALDVTVQARIMRLFRQLQEEIEFAFVLITHDIALCAQAADRIAVMYAGVIVEIAATRELIRNPLHPYTRGLLDSLPGRTARRELRSIPGTVPDPAAKPPGCFFSSRCPLAEARCRDELPEMREIAPDHWVRCVRV